MPSSVENVIAFRRLLDLAVEGRLDIKALYKTIRKLIEEEIQKNVFYCL